ncbi:GRAM domain-containing protein 2B-like isoform X2 [Gouania willdenowi]|uniref:GRAM domain-containing protein 2B-like isoform X2 n=1 Tax=Gouania willdenowi TaxID=441366 RepID=UPI001055B1C5|nr:GRAM domain-containing protein 2B-like isoform X2 [Gouania willdenowi]
MVLMTEQADRPGSPLSPVPPACEAAEAAPSCRESRRKRSTSEVDHGLGGRQRPTTRSPADLQLCVDTESDPSDSRRRAASSRLKPVEPLLSPTSLSDFETKLERKKSQPNQLSKTNAQYHKLFKEVRREELLKQSYTCALQRDILYQGKMFVSENWICFHSKVFGRNTKISIPVMSVTFIKKTKTARLVPNALVVETINDQHVFVSFLSRNTTFKLLKLLCCHLEVDKTCSSSVSSPSSLPLDFSGAFCDLDGMVQHRRGEMMMMESSSSGSQTPDDDKISDFSGLPDTFLSGVKSSEVSVHADVHLQAPAQKHGAALKNGLNKAASPCGVTCTTKPSPCVSLHAVLLLYLFLTAGGRGVAGDASAEIYGELSTNLFKLEKIQRNLRKLLEET